MSNYDFIGGGRGVRAWTRGVEFEPAARAQVQALASLPFLAGPVAVMPDVHAGIGATVGSVVATSSVIIPAAVGVDIGCGMIAQKTTLMASDLPDNLGAMRAAIETAVPHGRTDNGGPNDNGAWCGEVPTWVAGAFRDNLDDSWRVLLRKHPKLERANCARHLGTLGTGNHFIEVCLDRDDCVWVMLHSGSRGVGGQIGKQFIELARREAERWYAPLPNADLAYLPAGTQHFDDYVEAVSFAQRFATLNRQLMMSAALGAVADTLHRDVEWITHSFAVNCHHNYVSREHFGGRNLWITRKGAVRARAGEYGIIPGSMGARSYIVKGLGNEDSYCSCSHGAGRRMSRTEAKRRFTVADHIEATRGVECRKDEDVIDETPQAYKDIDAVMAAQSDLVEVVTELRQVLCVKG